VTGGSSCGSAAAVAASLCDFALGSDTAGSIRVPASFCGLYGLRPTYGRIETAGATAMAPSYDTVGFLAREAKLFSRVGRLLLQGESVAASIQRLILAQDLFAHSEASADEALWRALDRLKSALPRPEHLDVAGEEIIDWRDAFRIIQGFEIQSTLLPFINSHEVDLGPGIKERFEAASAITFAQAEKARALRGTIAERLHAQLQPGTLIVLPTTPTLPPERDIPDGAAFAEFRSLTLESTCVAAHAGVPQITVRAAEAASPLRITMPRAGAITATWSSSAWRAAIACSAWRMTAAKSWWPSFRSIAPPTCTASP
jgi:amidase